MAKPILKWIGGKTQLLEELKSNFPDKYNNYMEPFVGGGALFFNLEKEGSIINDANKELIELYETIAKNPMEIYEKLQSYKNNFDEFIRIRELDRDIESYNKLSLVEKACR
ncbi:MAG: DNA adenine methylase, partial [Campylobacterales bacterium]|nr:DNA adenine methylase [Campylobacterales bacterium]